MTIQISSNSLSDFEVQNLENYEDLLVSIEASEQRLSLLIAVCEDFRLRDQLIEQYESELKPDIHPYRIQLAQQEPSLRAAIATLVQSDPYLNQGGHAVLTVIGAEKLHFLKLGADRSEQDIFLGYLQWTREAFRAFPYPIVIWITQQIYQNLVQKSPDFWSWRKGVFRFLSKKTAAVSPKDIELFDLLPSREQFEDNAENLYLLPLEDLQGLIQSIEQTKGHENPALVTLYERVANIYRRRLSLSEFQDYQAEQTLAIQYFRQALDLRKKLNLSVGIDSTLTHLADLYTDQGSYREAEPLYRKALKLNKELLGDHHPDVAASLDNLAGLYHMTGRYVQAEQLYKQALEIRQQALGEADPAVATNLDHLAGLKHAQGEYEEAERLYRKALAIRQRVLGDDHLDLATSLNNLALLEYEQGRYGEAEPLFIQALALTRHLLGDDHPNVATSWNNLALLYYAQANYREAEDYLKRALELRQRLLGKAHPDVAGSLNNLAGLYKAQGRYAEAAPLYGEALEICEQTLGQNHPITAKFRDNLSKLRTVMSSTDDMD